MAWQRDDRSGGGEKGGGEAAATSLLLSPFLLFGTRVVEGEARSGKAGGGRSGGDRSRQRRVVQSDASGNCSSCFPAAYAAEDDDNDGFKKEEDAHLLFHFPSHPSSCRHGL